MIAIRGRPATSTGVSPFFLQHGCHVDPIELHAPPPTQEYSINEQDGKKTAEALIEKFKQVFELAQASMAEAQQEQGRQANRHRKQPEQLRVGDKVWLSFVKHFSTKRSSKKLDWKNSKYTVTELIGTQDVRLNLPTGHHNVFNVNRLRLAADDLLPSPPNDDSQPEALIIDGELEYTVEMIMLEKVQKKGRGFFAQYEVKWKGYADSTWCPARDSEDNIALDEWETYTAPFRNNSGRLASNFR